MLIYLILSFAPFLIEALYGYCTYFMISDMPLWAGNWGTIWTFLIYPAYLLLLNFYFIDIKVTSYMKALIIMLLISILRAGYMLVFHKMRYGEFFGDVPGEIYIFIIGIPAAIAIVGLVIIYFINKNNQW